MICYLVVILFFQVQTYGRKALCVVNVRVGVLGKVYLEVLYKPCTKGRVSYTHYPYTKTMNHPLAHLLQLLFHHLTPSTSRFLL